MAFHNFQFILIDADEYAVNYMEKHSADFPQANIQFILPKLKRILEQKYEEIKADFQQHDPGNEGRIPGDIFRWVAKRVIWYYLTQMYTLPPLFPPLPPPLPIRVPCQTPPVPEYVLSSLTQKAVICVRSESPSPPRQEFVLGIVNIQCPYFVGGESMLRRDLNLRRQRRMAQSERWYSGFILGKLKKLLKVPLFFTGESCRSSGKISWLSTNN